MTTYRASLRFSVVCAAMLCIGTPAGANAVTIAPSQDNSIFEESENSCGIGPLFAGQTGSFGVRRALVRFDVASAVPAGSTIDSAELRLHVTRSGPFSSASDVFSLHRLTADWGEGASECQFGQGFLPQPGDATWSYRFHDTVTWSTPGGDFVATPSGTTAMPLFGTATFASTSQMIADVQAWLSAPATNFGWILLGPESGSRRARLVLSREEQDETADGPQLVVEFTPPATTPPAVPDGQTGSPLRIGKAAPGSPDLVVTWDDASCTGAAGYHLVYGTRSGFPAALGGTYALQGSVCDLGAASPYTWTGSPDPAVLDPVSRLLFVLVMANDDVTTEGSWGHASLGLERNGPGANGSSSQCGILDKDVSNACGNGP